MIRTWSGSARLCAMSMLAALSMPGCQNPTDPTDTVNYSEAIDITVSPDPIFADTATGGKTYRVVRGNNQPDELLPYDWHAVFSSTLAAQRQGDSRGPRPRLSRPRQRRHAHRQAGDGRDHYASEWNRQGSLRVRSAQRERQSVSRGWETPSR